MPKRKPNPLPEQPSGMRPALTPEARENQMISLAFDLAEQRLRDGTASSQEVVHFLKLGATRERIEREILEKQKDLISAKTASLESAKRVEELYTDAMVAFRRYSGQVGEVDDENFY